MAGNKRDDLGEDFTFSDAMWVVSTVTVVVTVFTGLVFGVAKIVQWII